MDAALFTNHLKRQLDFKSRNRRRRKRRGRKGEKEEEKMMTRNPSFPYMISPGLWTSIFPFFFFIKCKTVCPFLFHMKDIKTNL